MRIAITVALIVVSYFGQFLFIPWIRGTGQFTGLSFSFTGLGLRPIVTGFMIAELLSFVLPPWRRWRRSGRAGRSRINMWAVGLGMALAAFQAFAITVAMDRAEAIVSWRILSILSLVAGTAFLLTLARMISRWGLGDGIAVMLVASLVMPVLLGAVLLFKDAQTVSTSLLSDRALELMVVAVTVAILIRVFRHTSHVSSSDARGVPSLGLPAFPQGTLPVLWVLGGLATYDTFRAFAGGNGTASDSPYIVLTIAATAIAALSLATFHLFSSRKRLERNLSTSEAVDETAQEAWNKWKYSTVLLVIMGVLASGVAFVDFQIVTIGLPGLAALVALGFDLTGEWHFRRHCLGSVVTVLEMDNVYNAYLLRTQLGRGGVHSLVRGYHLRSLFFFLGAGPSLKMSLMVSANDLEVAVRIIEPETIEIV